MDWDDVEALTQKPWLANLFRPSQDDCGGGDRGVLPGVACQLIMPIEFSSANVARFRRAALQAALRTRMDHNAAEDVAQEAVILLYRNRGQITCERAVESWLKTTATRLAVRRQCSSSRLVSLYDRDDGFCTEDAVVDYIDRRRIRSKIDWGLGQLSTTQRSLLTAIYFEGMSYAEASRKLGIAVGTIGPCRKRAIDRLLAKFEDVGTLAA